MSTRASSSALITQVDELFASDDPELRRQAVERAAGSDDREAAELIVRALADEDWRVRKAAVQALRERETEPWLVERLVQALLPGDNVGLRNSAVEALGAHGEVTVQAVAETLSVLDVDGLKLAAEALAQTQSATAMPVLQQLGRHEDQNVRAAALEAIAQVGRVAPDAAAQVLDVALEESDPFLRLVTLDVIRRLGLSPSWDRLRRLLADPMLIQTGLELAARLGEPLAAPHFVNELEASISEPAGGPSSFPARVLAAPTHRIARALRHLTQFMETGPAAQTASQQALRAVSEGTWLRLLALSQQRSDSLLAGDALLVLALRPDPRAAVIALDSLSDERLSSVAHRAVRLLGAAAKPALLERLLHGEVQERAMAVESLAQLALQAAEREAIAAVLRSLDDDEPQVIRAWLAAMTSLVDSAGLLRALDWLEGEVPPGVRRAAGAAAQTLAAAFPEKAKRASVGVHPKGGQAARVCWFVAASNAAVLQDVAADRAFLFAAASNPDPHVRAAALTALPRFSEPGALEAALFALNDEVQEVQLAAIRSLGQMRDAEGRPAGSPYVLDFAASSNDAVLVGEALRSLGGAPEPRALQFLLQWAKDAVVWKAVAAIEVLGPLAVPERATALQHALSHAEPEPVKAALQVLIADAQRFEPEVILCLRNKHPDVRRLAVEVLSAHPTRNSRTALRTQLGVETEAPVKEAIVRALSHSVPGSSLRSIPPPAEREAE